MSAIDHISSIFPNYNTIEFRYSLNNHLLDFLLSRSNLKQDGKNDLDVVKQTISYYVLETSLSEYFSYDHESVGNDFNLIYTLKPIIFDLLSDIFVSYYFSANDYKESDIKRMIELSIEVLRNCNDSNNPVLGQSSNSNNED